MIRFLIAAIFVVSLAPLAMADNKSWINRASSSGTDSGVMCNSLPTYASCAACARKKGYSPAEYNSRACAGKS